MPNVTVSLSQDQAARLAHGESVTIDPPKPMRTYIVVGSLGAIYECKTVEQMPTSFTTYRAPGTTKRLRNGVLGQRGPTPVGETRPSISFSSIYYGGGGGFTAVEVEG